MASFTISAAPWPVGTVATAYPAAAWVDPRTAPSGPAVATSTVLSNGTVTFDSLEEDRRFVAWALGLGVRFGTAASGLQAAVATPDRERIKALEDTVASGGAAGTGGARVLLWQSGAYDHPEWWADTSVPREFRGPTDPSTVPEITLTFGDVWTPTAEPTLP